MCSDKSIKKVLVVDDEPDTLELVKLVLESGDLKPSWQITG